MSITICVAAVVGVAARACIVLLGKYAGKYAAFAIKRPRGELAMTAVPSEEATGGARDRFTRQNVVATFLEPEDADRAVRALERAGVDRTDISLLGREDRLAVYQAEEKSESEELPGSVAKSVAITGAEGAAAGGIAGFIAGAAAFGIPGIGPAVGAGIWAATASGAVAGSVAGGVIGGIRKTWAARYEDAIKEGRVLVGVHSEDAEEVDSAERIMREAGTERTDRFDSEGRLTSSSDPSMTE
jgi:outer membrane lipoprotein SlyB